VVFVQSCEWAEDIDVKRAQEAGARGRKAEAETAYMITVHRKSLGKSDGQISLPEETDQSGQIIKSGISSRF
jgi:hypothetical protein